MDKKKRIKPEYTDPTKEAINHPNGPGLQEMIAGEETKAESYPELQKQMRQKPEDDEPVS
jgi:hypothetical protein